MHTTRSLAAPASPAWMAPLHLLRSWLMPARTPITHYAPPRSAPRIPHQLALPFSLPAQPQAEQNVTALSCSAWQQPVPLLRSTNQSVQKESAVHASALSTAQMYPRNAHVRGPRARLKVVRHLDTSLGPAYAGRMLISGRMDDVCAELERMSEPLVHPLSS